MAYWSGLRYVDKSPPPIPFGGDGVNTYNTPFELQKTELVSMKNLSNRVYPSLRTRRGTSSNFGTSNTSNYITDFNGAGVRNSSSIHITDGTVWKYYNSTGAAFVNITTQLTDSRAVILEFNTETDRYTFLTNGTDRKYWDGSAVADSTGSPSTKLYTVDDYRLYALTGSVLQCSAIGTITDWTTTDDADTIAVTGMQGTGTAIIAYNDMVICFSDQTMHILYGNDPGDFQLMDPINSGCVGHKSLTVHNGVLYFLDYDEFKVFTGGLPVEIGQKVKTYLEDINYTYKDNIICKGWRRWIYLSIPYGASQTTNNYTLEYDTETKTWCVWDVGYDDFVTIGEDLYGVDTDGKIRKINTGTTDDGTAITWEATTGVWEGIPLRGRKVVSDIWAIVDLPSGSTMTISYSTTVDNDDFTTLASFTADSDEQNTRIKVPTSILQNITWYRLKISGTGNATIHYIEPHIRVKAR